MSYCRINESSDVYVYANIAGYWEVVIGYDVDTRFKNTQHDKRTEVRARLEKLQASGLKVPKRVFARLEREIFEHEPDHWRGKVE